MRILVRGIRAPGTSGQIDLTVRRCCRTIGWTLTIRLG